MQRDIDLVVDASSWPGGVVPADLTGAATMGTWSCCVDAALLSLAIHTRPPIVHGFDLADMWAWMRYLPAIAPATDLRLRQEWSNVDAHQKSVLSDDFGVGFTTWFLIEQLHFLTFVETSHFIRCVAPPGAYHLLNSKKSGPGKTPDYIGFDNHWRMSVLECKGSQTSRKVLEDAIASGVSQKRNFRNSAVAAAPHLSLVAGLYIPQWAASSDPLLLIADPEWDQAGLLDDIDPNILIAGAIQLTLAKMFALMGLPSLATELANTPTLELSGVQSDRVEMKTLKSAGPNRDRMEWRYAYPLAPDRFAIEGQGVAAVEFAVSVPMDLFDKIASPDLLKSLIKMGHDMQNSRWNWRTEETHTMIESPLGFQLEISYLLRDPKEKLKPKGTR